MKEFVNKTNVSFQKARYRTESMHRNYTYGIYRDNYRLRHDLRPWDLDEQLVDAAGDQREGQCNFLLKHVGFEHQVV